MIITYFGIIVFHLVEWIDIVAKSSEAVTEEKHDMLAFSYLANPSRHPVPSVPIWI